MSGDKTCSCNCNCKGAECTVSKEEVYKKLEKEGINLSADEKKQFEALLPAVVSRAHKAHALGKKELTSEELIDCTGGGSPNVNKAFEVIGKLVVGGSAIALATFGVAKVCEMNDRLHGLEKGHARTCERLSAQDRRQDGLENALNRKY